MVMRTCDGDIYTGMHYLPALNNSSEEVIPRTRISSESCARISFLSFAGSWTDLPRLLISWAGTVLVANNISLHCLGLLVQVGHTLTPNGPVLSAGFSHAHPPPSQLMKPAIRLWPPLSGSAQ
jgi:hypothetical protein